MWIEKELSIEQALREELTGTTITNVFRMNSVAGFYVTLHNGNVLEISYQNAVNILDPEKESFDHRLGVIENDIHLIKEILENHLPKNLKS